ncbi:glycoside hydrolase family 28 protein [Sphingomonas sp. CL5.1]|nr:glycoside hydrolase family 28 protein [Sphingomonas sp. CL5.1]
MSGDHRSAPGDGFSATRRDLLRLGTFAAAAVAGRLISPGQAVAARPVRGQGGFAPPPGGGGFSARGWEDCPSILARIQVPIFPTRDFPITRFGARGNGRSDATSAIAAAIDACSHAGGGRVVVPAGDFLTAAIHLKSNVNLHLADGATLKFVTDPGRYPLVLTRWEGVECMNYSPFIYAFEQQNVAVTGRGTLDGQASLQNWWAWKSAAEAAAADNGNRAGSQGGRQGPDQKALDAMGETGVPVERRVFGPGHFLRPNFIQTYRCRNVLIEGVRIINSPMWEIHPVLSTNVTVRGVSIVSHGPNNDGCDPESCSDVLIEDCSFDTGDDCIAIKSGKNNDGRRVNVPCENIVVRNCRMKDGHGGVVLGSECSGDIRNVFVENCDMDSPNLERMLRFKNNAVRGGVLENVFARSIKVGRVAEAILTIDFLYDEGTAGSHTPVVRNVQMDGITSTSSPRVMYVVSFPGAVIDAISFANCLFSGVDATEVLNTSGRVSFRNVKIEPKEKPYSLSTRKNPS